MKANVGDLIANIEQAERAIQEIIAQGGEPDPDHLFQLDGRLEASYDALLSANLTCPDQRVERIGFLLDQIEEKSDGGAMLKQFTTVIMHDVLFILGNKDGRPQEPLRNKIEGSLAQILQK